MLINDRIYGNVDVAHPLIQELIKSEPMQRLHDVSQDGAIHFIYPSAYATRFEHCFGVWYLSYRFNRPIEEQVACLLHDVPHTAFSHVIDLVMNDSRQEYHERFLQELVLKSEIPAICAKHNVDINHVLQTDKFPLLENHTPELSFDRWDYFMRDAYTIGIMPFDLAERFITAAELQGEQLYFRDQSIAGLLCITSINTSELLYASHNPTAFAAWSMLAEAVKIALDSNLLSEADLFTTDTKVLAKMKAARNTDIDHQLRRLEPGTEFVLAKARDAEFTGKGKPRYIDPRVELDSKLVPVSELVVGLAARIKKFRADCQEISVKQKVQSN